MWHTTTQHYSTLFFAVMLGKKTHVLHWETAGFCRSCWRAQRGPRNQESSNVAAQLCKPGKNYSCWQACLGKAIRNQGAFTNVRLTPSRNLTYDHKHQECSVNHRGCWRICSRIKKKKEKKKTVGTLGSHSFQPFSIHRSVFSFPPTVSSRMFSACPSDVLVNHNF